MAVFIPVLQAALFGISLVAGAVGTTYFLTRDTPPVAPIPPPQANQPPFDAGFEGGQCLGVASQGYFVAVTRFFNPNTGEEYTNPSPVPFGSAYQMPTGVAVDSITVVDLGFFQSVRIVVSDGRVFTNSFQFGNSSGDIPITNISYQLYLYDYALNEIIPDECGNVPNPNTPIPVNVDGGDIYFIGDGDDPERGFDPVPLITGAAIVAALAAIAAAIKGVADSLSGIQKIGEALEKIAELLDKWDKRNQEEDKEKGSKRGFSTGNWYELPVDGGFGLKSITRDGKEHSPYQVQFLLERFPVSCSRRVGIRSVSFAHQEPIGWLMPRSVTRGFYEPAPIRYLNSIHSLPDDCDGFSFSFRENPDIEGKVRIIYSFPPEIED